MRKNVNIQYYVEGEDEKKLVNVLKSAMGSIRTGKVQTLNVLQEYISDTVLRTLKNGTVVVLVFDTDTNKVDVLNKNIKKLEACRQVADIITIPQVKNLEEELIYSCNIKKITELLNSSSVKDFKSDLIHISNLEQKLKEHKFDLKRFWSQQPVAPYQNILNDAEKIKIYNK